MMNSIVTLLSLIGLFLIVFYLYNEFRVDKLRQDLFEVRDRLFDDARDGRISFDSGAYKATRLMLNGMIRFGHRASLSQIIASRCMLKDEHRQYARTLVEGIAFADSPDEDRKRCAGYIHAANVVVARHFLSSPSLFLLLVPLLTLAFGGRLASAMVKKWKTAFAALDRVALEEGQHLQSERTAATN